MWKDALATKAKAAYMQHALDGRAVRSVRFCPYEDTLAVGHSGGLSTLIVPGAGEANFDSFVANPFQTLRERREQEVHQLMDKLQPDMIMLNPTAIASVRSHCHFPCPAPPVLLPAARMPPVRDMYIS